MAITGACSGQESWRPKDLVKVLLLLIQSSAGSIGSLHINHQVLHFILQPLLCLFQGGTFGIDSFHMFLCILQTLGQLLSGGEAECYIRVWKEISSILS